MTNRANLSRLQLEIGAARDAERDALERSRIEDLYRQVWEWRQAFDRRWLALAPVMKGEIDYNAGLDLQIELGKDSNVDFSRIQMLIDFYYPSLRDPLEGMLAHRDSMNDVISAHKNAYKMGDSQQDRFLDQMLREALAFNESADALQTCIAAVVRKAFGT